MKRINAVLLISGMYFLSLSTQSCFQKKPDALSEELISETDYTDTLRDSENLLNLKGQYQGTLPCSDCDGELTTITLNDNLTYHKTISYLGKPDTLQIEDGKWTINGSVLKMRNQLNAFQMYNVGENYLQKLDSNGKKISGEFAEMYILKKEIN
jgi:copper homeostasis protein (lipoprotein)